MTTRLVLCLAVLLLAGACTTTGGGKDRSRHRTGPPKPPHHYAHKHDRLRNRMLLAAGVMRACGRHNDARRAIWNATVANKWLFALGEPLRSDPPPDEAIARYYALDDRDVSPPNVRTAGQGLAETIVNADHAGNRLRGLGVS